MTLHTKEFMEDILSGLFPALCPLCRTVILKKNAYFCPSCLQEFERITPPFCICCGEPLPGKREKTALLCLKCLFHHDIRETPLLTRSAAFYCGNLRQAILKLKYQGHLYMAPPLGKFIREQYPLFFFHGQFDAVLPVPLHLKRLRQREFNQCALLAQPLAKYLEIPLDLDSVVRTRHTFSQSISKSAQRRHNLKGAFQVIRPAAVSGKRLLIFDDVYTTGATLEALALSLYSTGARKVSAFTLARTLKRGLNETIRQKAE